VQLPDEYDQIYHDLEPFWGVQPHELRESQKALEKETDTYTLGKDEKGRVTVVTWAFEEGKYDNYIWASTLVIDLLQDVAEYLPADFRATFSPHDGPNRLSDYHIKKASLDAAARGTRELI